MTSSESFYPSTIEVEGTFPSSFGGEARILQAKPVDTNIDSDRPVYFHGGYGVNCSDYLQYIAEQYGRSAFSVVYDTARPRDTGYWFGYPGEQASSLFVPRERVRQVASTFTGPIIAKSQIDLAADILRAMDTLGAEEADAIGQSVGTLRVDLAAHKAPERFKGIVKAYPAGVIKPDPSRVMWGSLQYAKAWRSHLKIVNEDTLGASLRTPRTSSSAQRLPRNTLSEGETVLLSHQSEILHSLRTQDNAPAVAVVAGENDFIFLPERILESLRTPRDIDVMYVTPGLHAIGRRKKVMDKVMDLLGSTAEAHSGLAVSEQCGAASFFGRLVIDPEVTSRRALEIYNSARLRDERLNT